MSIFLYLGIVGLAFPNSQLETMFLPCSPKPSNSENISFDKPRFCLFSLISSSNVIGNSKMIFLPITICIERMNLGQFYYCEWFIFLIFSKLSLTIIHNVNSIKYLFSFNTYTLLKLISIRPSREYLPHTSRT